MKSFKRISAILVAVAMLFSFATITATADEPLKLTYKTSTVGTNYTIEVFAPAGTYSAATIDMTSVGNALQVRDETGDIPVVVATTSAGVSLSTSSPWRISWIIARNVATDGGLLFSITFPIADANGDFTVEFAGRAGSAFAGVELKVEADDNGGTDPTPCDDCGKYPCDCPIIGPVRTLIYTVDGAEFSALAAVNAKTVVLNRAGSPTYAYVAGTGLTISGRTANWNSVDFIFDNLKPNATYFLEVGFSTTVAGGIQYVLGMPNSPWGEFTRSSTAVMSETLSHEFTLDAAGTLGGQPAIRMQTVGTGDYTITSIKIYSEDGEVIIPSVGNECPDCGEEDCDGNCDVGPVVCPDCGEEDCVCDPCDVCGNEPCTCPVGCDDCGEEPCTCVDVCDECGEEPCTCEDEVCPDCGDEPCTCVNVCEDCGKDPCDCEEDILCGECGQDPCDCNQDTGVALAIVPALVAAAAVAVATRRKRK
jgi:hypothetical protein